MQRKRKRQTYKGLLMRNSLGRGNGCCASKNHSLPEVNVYAIHPLTRQGTAQLVCSSSDSSL